MLSDQPRKHSCINGNAYGVGLVITDRRGVVIDTSDHAVSLGQQSVLAGWARSPHQGEWAHPLYIGLDVKFEQGVPLDTLLAYVKQLPPANEFYHRQTMTSVDPVSEQDVVYHPLDVGQPSLKHEPIPATPGTDLRPVVDGVVRTRAADEFVGDDVFHPLYWLMHVRVATLRENENARMNPLSATVLVARNPNLFGVTLDSGTLLVRRVQAPLVRLDDHAETLSRGLDVDHLSASVDAIMFHWNREFLNQKPLSVNPRYPREIVMDMYPPVGLAAESTYNRSSVSQLDRDLARSRLILRTHDRRREPFAGGRTTVRSLLFAALVGVPRGNYDVVRSKINGAVDRMRSDEVWKHVLPKLIVFRLGGTTSDIRPGEADYAIEIAPSRTHYMDAAGRDVSQEAEWEVDLRNEIWLATHLRALLRARAPPAVVTVRSIAHAPPAVPADAPNPKRGPGFNARKARRAEATRARLEMTEENYPLIGGPGLAKLGRMRYSFATRRNDRNNALVVVSNVVDMPRDGDCFFTASGYSRERCASVSGVGVIDAGGLTPRQFVLLVNYFNLSVVHLRAPLAGVHGARVRGLRWIGICDSHCFGVEIRSVRAHWGMRLLGMGTAAVGLTAAAIALPMVAPLIVAKAALMIGSSVCVTSGANRFVAYRHAQRAADSYDAIWHESLGDYPFIAPRRLLGYGSDMNAQMNSRLLTLISALGKHGFNSNEAAVALQPACVSLGPFGSGGPRHTPDAVKHAMMYAAAAVLRSPRPIAVAWCTAPGSSAPLPLVAVAVCIPDPMCPQRPPGQQYTSTQAICLGAAHHISPTRHTVGLCKTDRCEDRAIIVGCMLFGPASGPCFSLMSCVHNLRNALVTRHAVDEAQSELFMAFPPGWRRLLRAVRAEYPNFCSPNDKFIEWIARYPEHVRKSLTKTLLEATPKKRSVDFVGAFPKVGVELSVPEKARTIQAYLDDLDKILTGPDIAAMQKAFKSICRNFEVYPNVFITFGCGMSLEDIGHWAEFEHDYVYERDGKRWDSTMGITHYLFRLRSYEFVIPNYSKDGRYPALTTQGRYSKGDEHFKYVVEGTVKSGHNDTTLGNTIINLMIAAAAVHEQRPDKPVRVIACGDDLLVLSSARLNGARIAAVEKKYGIIPKYGEFADVTDASFISLNFWRVAGNVIALPKPGRLARKQYWTARPPADVDAWIKSVSGGLANLRHVPIFRELWAFGKGDVTDIIAERWERSRLENVLSPADGDLIGKAMCAKYGISDDELDSACKALARIRHGGPYLATGDGAVVLDRMLAFDQLDPEERPACYMPCRDDEPVNLASDPASDLQWVKYAKSLPTCLLTSSQIASLPQCSAPVSTVQPPAGSVVPPTPQVPLPVTASPTALAGASQPPGSSPSIPSTSPQPRVASTTQSSSSRAVATQPASLPTGIPASTSMTANRSHPSSSTTKSPPGRGHQTYLSLRRRRGAHSSVLPLATIPASAGPAASSRSNLSCPTSTTRGSLPLVPTAVHPPTSASLTATVTPVTTALSTGPSTKPSSPNSRRVATQRQRKKGLTSPS